jgi:hypothetical protein
MIAITKSVIALSAAMSAGFVTVYDMNRIDQPTAAVQVAQRFPVASEMFAPLTLSSNSASSFALPKADRAPLAADNCAGQGWPYIAQACLTSGDGKPMRKVARVITVERRAGDNSSELTRVSVTTVANR